MTPLASLERKLIVSCQAEAGDPFREPGAIARFAEAAGMAGAGGLRVNGADDVRATRRVSKLPLIGIEKALMPDGRILITPSFEAARALVDAGADLVALDFTERGQACGAAERLRRIRAELGVATLADIATEEEAAAAREAGADAVVTTLRGYTNGTAHVTAFDPLFVERLAARLRVPVIAEGRIGSPEEARAAIAAGAYAVVVGTAITRPRDIARRFVEAVEREVRARRRGATVAAIDMGGTNTKSGLVSDAGELLWTATAPTPATEGRQALLDHLHRVAARALEVAAARGIAVDGVGIATAGWVDVNTGVVVYATDTLREWTGARVGETLRQALGVPVAVENDANALALAEKRFGAGRGLSDFVCITLGTGVGGGCFIGGALRRGAHFAGNAIGHLSLDAGGARCICGQRGCLETCANAAAMLRYAGGEFASCEALVAAANAGHTKAEAAVKETARHLARACALLVDLLDPQAIVLSGGPAQNNALLAHEVAEGLGRLISDSASRRVRVACSTLGYHGGVLGAAALALDLTR